MNLDMCTQRYTSYLHTTRDCSARSAIPWQSVQLLYLIPSSASACAAGGTLHPNAQRFSQKICRYKETRCRLLLHPANSHREVEGRLDNSLVTKCTQVGQSQQQMQWQKNDTTFMRQSSTVTRQKQGTLHPLMPILERHERTCRIHRAGH